MDNVSISEDVTKNWHFKDKIMEKQRRSIKPHKNSHMNVFQRYENFTTIFININISFLISFSRTNVPWMSQTLVSECWEYIFEKQHLSALNLKKDSFLLTGIQILLNILFKCTDLMETMWIFYLKCAKSVKMNEWSLFIHV